MHTPPLLLAELEEGSEEGAAAAASAASPQHDLLNSKGWLKGGHFEALKLICNGKEGDLVELGSVVKVEDTLG